MTAESFEQASSAEMVASIARPSMVGVRSPSSQGTGWIALGNGLVLTSHEAVGFHPMVDLDLGGNRYVAARVVWVDVAHDMAALLPVDSLTLPPLDIRPDLPRAGEVAYVVSFAAGEPFRITRALVTAIDCRFGSLRCFEIEGQEAASGSAVLDCAGQVIGVAGLDLPRGTHRNGRPPPAVARALPAATLLRAVAEFDLPRGGAIETRTPAYACPWCGQLFSADQERCAACGSRLPHIYETTAVAGPGEQLIRDLLANMGAVSGTIRTGARQWTLLAPVGGDAGPRATQPMVRRNVEIVLELDENYRTFLGRSPIVRLPGANHEAFYRFLLTANDQGLTGYRLALNEGVVELAFVEPIVGLRAHDAAAIVKELMRLGDHFRKVLSEPFDAQPVFSGT